MSLELEFLFEDELSLKDLPIPKNKLRRLLKILIKEIAKSEEFNSCIKILGLIPESVSILYCGDKTMRKFNHQYRHLDRTTDVLSFPTQEWNQEVLNIKGLKFSLGDLLMSQEAIKRGAKRGKRSEAEEFLDVFIHGLLHLLGFDHIKNVKKAKRVKDLQRALYLKLKKDI